MLPPGQKADTCPYCGSNRFVSSEESAELVDPQAIVLMKIDAQEARRRVSAWMGKGYFAPDDLLLQISRLQLRPAYYPFWTFDGTLELPWYCEVNEGSSDNPRWVTRNGSEFEMFDDLLVPGTRAITFDKLTKIEPFNLTEAVEFTPEYLAGWTALGYEYSLADASLKAREVVVKEVRRSLHNNVEPTRQKRDLRPGAGKWSGFTYKHILLPLWVGSYHFKGEEYTLMVNGQTGKVSGEKPRDNVKAAIAGIAVFITIALIATLIILWWLRSGNSLLGG